MALWELLHLILPRFLRITVKNATTSEKEIIQKLQEDNPCVPILEVCWLTGFVSLPGYVPISSLTIAVQEGVHIFPMDVASGIPPTMLAKVSSSTSPTKVLDLCCCPGGKFLMISDFLRPTDTLVGVDISKQRMFTTKCLVNKYLNSVYANTSSVQQLTAQDHVHELTPVCAPVPPRMLLFCADGIAFSSASSSCLLYDSRIGMEEIRHRGNKRKRNKSTRGREEKRLRMVREELAAAAAAADIVVPEKCDVSASGNQGAHLNRLSSPAEHDFSNVFDKYDAVLVDAQCTHDSSYRHMRYVGSDTAPNTTNASNGNHFDHIQGVAWKNECRKYKNIESVESNDSVYELQRQLLAKGFSSLADGGELIYSTCSAEVEQNERVVEWLLQREKGNVELLSVAEWCSGTGIETSSSPCKNKSKDKNMDNKSDDDLKQLVMLLAQGPGAYALLLEFLLCRYTGDKCSEDSANTNKDSTLSMTTEPSALFRNLADTLCREYSSISSPPGRAGTLKGCAYFGMWGGTSGLFLSRMRKVKQHTL